MVDDNYKEQARQRLLEVLPHIRFAAATGEVSMPDARICLALTAVNEDGTGRILCQFDHADFVEDLSLILEE